MARKLVLRGGEAFQRQSVGTQASTVAFPGIRSAVVAAVVGAATVAAVAVVAGGWSQGKGPDAWSLVRSLVLRLAMFQAVIDGLLSLRQVVLGFDELLQNIDRLLVIIFCCLGFYFGAVLNFVTHRVTFGLGVSRLQCHGDAWGCHVLIVTSSKSRFSNF